MFPSDWFPIHLWEVRKIKVDFIVRINWLVMAKFHLYSPDLTLPTIDCNAESFQSTCNAHISFVTTNSDCFHLYKGVLMSTWSMEIWREATLQQREVFLMCGLFSCEIIENGFGDNKNVCFRKILISKFSISLNDLPNQFGVCHKSIQVSKVRSYYRFII
jgi:hypothetical protein